MSEGHAGESSNNRRPNGSSDNAGQTNRDGSRISSLRSQKMLTQAALKLAEQAEQEAKDLELESQEVERQYNGLKRAAEAEVRKEKAKKRLIEIRRKVAEMEKDRSSVHHEAASEIVSTSSTNQKRTESNPSAAPTNVDPFILEQQNLMKFYSKSRKRTSQVRDDIRTKHGEWTEKQARDILNGCLELPLIQTTLNFFESFLTVEMLKELADTLKSTPRAKNDRRVLEARWGGNSKDYFKECAKWTKARKVRRMFSWNRYSHQGYIRHSHEGPPSQTKLFGYQVQSKDNQDGHVSLSTLYRSFLRTEHAAKYPCDSHRLNILGQSDTCNGCGLTGSAIG